MAPDIIFHAFTLSTNINPFLVLSFCPPPPKAFWIAEGTKHLTAKAPLSPSPHCERGTLACRTLLAFQGFWGQAKGGGGRESCMPHWNQDPMWKGSWVPRHVSSAKQMLPRASNSAKVGQVLESFTIFFPSSLTSDSNLWNELQETRSERCHWNLDTDENWKWSSTPISAWFLPLPGPQPLPASVAFHDGAFLSAAAIPPRYSWGSS